MSSPKRLVLLVEGHADVDSVPVMVSRVITEMGGWSDILLDKEPIRTGGLGALVKDGFKSWTNRLALARKRNQFAGALILLDGDAKYSHFPNRGRPERFCPATAAIQLGIEAKKAGAGGVFSVAIVFARQEFEPWLLAGIESLRGRKLPDGRSGVLENAALPEHLDTDMHPRDAKKMLSEYMLFPYRQSVDQKDLARLVSLDAIRKRNPRSFRRFESAIKQLCDAFRDGQHIVSPLPR